MHSSTGLHSSQVRSCHSALTGGSTMSGGSRRKWAALTWYLAVLTGIARAAEVTSVKDLVWAGNTLPFLGQPCSRDTHSKHTLTPESRTRVKDTGLNTYWPNKICPSCYLCFVLMTVGVWGRWLPPWCPLVAALWHQCSPPYSPAAGWGPGPLWRWIWLCWGGWRSK